MIGLNATQSSISYEIYKIYRSIQTLLLNGEKVYYSLHVSDIFKTLAAPVVFCTVASNLGNNCVYVETRILKKAIVFNSQYGMETCLEKKSFPC